jgi:hypothetical protein
MSYTTQIRMLASMVALHAGAVVLCLTLFLLVSAAGMFGGVSILFYRGIADLVALAPVTFVVLLLVLRLPRVAQFLTARDAAAATLVAVSLNLTFFVVGPVTVDRSVSVFMLSRLADAQSPQTAEELRQAFAERYLGEWDQVGRRIQEQIASGNVEQASEDHYRLTAQGTSFMRTAQLISRVFGGDPRFVGLEHPKQQDTAEARSASGLRERIMPHE